MLSIAELRLAAYRLALIAILVLASVPHWASANDATTFGPAYDAAKETPRILPKVAKGSPNVIWILLDDVGYGAVGTFGGLIATPNFDKLANNGLSYTNFHTMGICAPTRAALLTGRNHHTVGMGMFPHPFLSAGFPGYSGRMEWKDGMIAEYLRDAGYNTYMLGKWHLTPDEETTDLGPFDRWPTSRGFDHFFGFLGGATDQYKPDLIEDTQRIQPDGRHFNAQLVDKAIAYMDRQKKLNPDKPFFMHIATGAAHSPHQVGREWISKYKGQFDEGWDVARERILARQKKLGVVPANAKLPPRESRVPAWNSLSAEEKAVYLRFMESYAGFLEYTDSEIGRLVEHLEKTGVADNTVIFLIVGDNGGSKEGGPNGTLEPELVNPNLDLKAQLEHLHAHVDEIGTGETYSNYPVGWAQAMNTPFRQWKGDVNAEGAIRNPMIVYWPGHIKKGIRTQYGHVTDLLPTTLEMVNVPAPASVRGVAQTPIQGTSLTYSFNDARAATRHTKQYYFLFGSGAIVKDGWKASFRYRPDLLDIYVTPRDQFPAIKAKNDVWELYNLNTDFNELNDLAAKEPQRLEALQEVFKQEAEANQVYPLINLGHLEVKLREAMSKRGAPGTTGHAH